MPCELFFDIGTLREQFFTGIPKVAAGLAQRILALGLPCTFFVGDNVIRREFVEFLLETGCGSYFGYHHQLWQTVEGGLLARVAAARHPTLGLFPAEKPFHRMFDREVQVVHDFSTLTTPYFHAPATLQLHGGNLLADVRSNDLSVCVSAATAGYLRKLVPEVADRVAVVPNGCEWPTQFAARDQACFGRLRFEPYLLVLGTLEPRKNLELLFRALAADPLLLERYRLVFTGKPGWLFDFNRTVRQHLGEAGDRVVYAGFVDEFKKYSLLRHARFTIYPSLHEGFGLPILESFSVGTPCVHSASSSMPEVSGDLGFTFDPEDPAGLLAAIYRAEAALEEDAAGLRRRCLAQAAGFTWERMLDGILDAAATLEARR